MLNVGPYYTDIIVRIFCFKQNQVFSLLETKIDGFIMVVGDLTKKSPLAVLSVHKSGHIINFGGEHQK